jgi:DNA-directed RNA polymerase subunit omega
MINPPIEDVLEQSGTRFTLVVLSARRARQINAYFKQLGEGIGTYAPPQVQSFSRKPLSIAFEEIAEGKVEVEHVESEEG